MSKVISSLLLVFESHTKWFSSIHNVSLILSAYQSFSVPLARGVQCENDDISADIEQF